MTLEDVLARCVRDDRTGCLLWTGPLFDGKYGGVYDGCGHRYYTHRYVWESHNGPLQSDQCVRHSCDRFRCCEISHLAVGTHTDNMIDMARRGRSNSRYSPRLILAVHRLCKSGKFSDRHIGEKLGIPQTTVSQIHRGARWRRYIEEATRDQ